MIKYTLKCADGHQFESWFQNSEAYEKLRLAGQLACAVCGHLDVEKAIMAPRVNLPSKSKSEISAPLAESTSLQSPMSPAEEAMKQLRDHVEATSENVGDKFVDEVRAIHYGDAPERSIFGEAKGRDAKALWDEGIPVAPLPWSSNKTKVN